MINAIVAGILDAHGIPQEDRPDELKTVKGIPS